MLESTKDLITQLLIKDPTKRIGSTMGAATIKHHPFFNGVNWALLRCTKPPYIPQLIDYQDFVVVTSSSYNFVKYYYHREISNLIVISIIFMHY